MLHAIDCKSKIRQYLQLSHRPLGTFFTILALFQGGDIYTMTSSPRGFALVISNINFPFREDNVRYGGENDETRISDLLCEFGFEVTLKRDVMSTVRTAQKEA
jgi:hypothetical protein